MRGSSRKLEHDMPTRRLAPQPGPAGRFRSSILVLLVTFASACATIPVPLDSGPRAALESIEREPQGELVYEGTVYDPEHPETPAFAYERWVDREGAERTSTHLTRTPTDELFLLLAARHTSDFELVELQQINRQTGVSGRARMLDDHHVEFERTRAGKRRTHVEVVNDPVVVAPTLFGWAIAHWDAIVGGEPQRVRFATIEDARTYGFELGLAEQDAATIVMSFRATEPLVRTVVPPMRLVFDRSSRKILRYEGRVPAMREQGHGLRPLDARVEYEFVAPAFL